MQVNDDLYMGTAVIPVAQSAANPTLQYAAGPLGRIYFYNIVPLTKQAANVAALAALTIATAMTLAAGTGATSGVAPDGSGRTVIVLDVPRAVALTSTANLSGVNITIVGFDTYGRQITQTRAGPNNTTVNTLKAFKSVLSVTPDATNAGTMSVGTADIFGLPFAAIDAGYIMPKWNNTLAQDAGTFVAAVTTDPNTAAIGDTRGTYAPSSASDGSKRLVVWHHLTGSQCGPNATTVSAIGVTPV